MKGNLKRPLLLQSISNAIDNVVEISGEAATPHVLGENVRTVARNELVLVNLFQKFCAR
jgi:hypothetical protein